MTQSKFTRELERRYGKQLKDKKKSTMSSFFNIPVKFMDEVYDRGLAAARSTGVRASVNSDDQWARARLNKFILSVMDSRDGKKVNEGPGQDGDVVLKALGKVMTLKKARGGTAKYVARLGGKSYKFGDKNYRDFILMNSKKSKYYEPLSKERERIKNNYRRRHRGDGLDKISSGSLSYYLLWNEPTLKESISDFEKRFKIKIIT